MWALGLSDTLITRVTLRLVEILAVKLQTLVSEMVPEAILITHCSKDIATKSVATLPTCKISRRSVALSPRYLFLDSWAYTDLGLVFNKMH